jgi:hypothetical protein
MTIPPESFDEQSDPQFPQPEEPLDDYSPIAENPTEEPAKAPYTPPIMRPVDDLTVAELIGEFFRAPGLTLDAFLRVVQTPAHDKPSIPVEVPAIPRSTPLPVKPVVEATKPAVEQDRASSQREAIRLGLRFTALIIAIYGNGILSTQRVGDVGLDLGAPYLLIGFLLWIVAEVYGSWPAIVRWVQRRRDVETAPDVRVDTPEASGIADKENLAIAWTTRLILAAGAAVFSVLTANFTSGNLFRLQGVITWGLSIILWVMAFAPAGWGLSALWGAIRKIHVRINWTFWTMLVIMVIAAYFRLYNLNATPPEMTSDHVEKILDSQRILDGTPQVFFPNNGGREAIQFYLVALVSQFPGLGMNFFTLKLVTAVEGLITIPILWWMGREIIGEDEPELGNIVGLVLAALVAVSYWDVMLSRLGLRIVLTTLFTALLVIYLGRGLRFNQRGDFIKAGLTLGFGMYAYQAVRMLPLVVILGVLIAIVFAWMRKRKEHQTGRYLFNSTALVIVSLAVFVPLLVFSIQYPNDFWRRTSGRLLGDDLIQTTNEKGELVERVATLDERLAAFRLNVPIVIDNIHNALLMYNWRGDVAWVTAAPNLPEMDVYTGALLVIGLGAWLVRMVRRRDPTNWLMIPMLFIMLLPSALSIAYPVENPSATRTSGTLPEAYLFAAVPLALIVLSLQRLMSRRAGLTAGFVLVGMVTFLAGGANWNTYFNEYNQAYLVSSPAPYTEAGKVLKGFSESGGSFGNAFMIAYPYWWDHRAVGIEAGLLDWPNGIIKLEDTPQFLYDASLRTDRYRLDPEKDLMFFYSRQDTETDSQLKQWFPAGYSQLFTSYKPGADFMIYRVPRLGAQGFIDFAVRAGAAQQP